MYVLRRIVARSRNNYVVKTQQCIMCVCVVVVVAVAVLDVVELHVTVNYIKILSVAQ
jgi:hypothetical protein